MNPLLPDRYPNQDFFVADIFDATPKDDIASMEHPMFSLATRPDMDRRFYEHNDSSIEIIPSGIGLATIWDKDILIYSISQLMEGINRGREPSPVIRLTAYDLLISTNRQTGGDHYKRLESAFTRLRGTQIKTNITTNGIKVTEGFGFIDRWKIIERSSSDERMVAVEIKLSDWLYNAVMGTDLLTINRDYFRIRGGLERRLYELVRKHCGSQSRWPVGMETLHKKSGAKCTVRLFRSRVKKIVTTDILPDYRVTYNQEKDQVVFYNRKGNKAAKAKFNDDMKNLFPSGKPEHQTVLDL